MQKLAQSADDLLKAVQTLTPEDLRRAVSGATVVEWFDDRYYRIARKEEELVVDVDWYPSVNTVLGIINQPWLNAFRESVGAYEANRRLTYAQWRGSVVHDGIHRLTTQDEIWLVDPMTGMQVFTQEQWVMIMRYLDFYRTLKPKIILSEHTVWSDTYRSAGTLDQLVYFEKDIIDFQLNSQKKIDIPSGYYILDVKSGSSIDKKAYYQTGAYARFQWERREDIEVPLPEPMGSLPGSIILHLNSKSKREWGLTVFDPKQTAYHFEIFEHALAIWNEDNPNRAPEIRQLPLRLSLKEDEDATVQGLGGSDSGDGSGGPSRGREGSGRKGSKRNRGKTK